jgi:transposase-like protein
MEPRVSSAADEAGNREAPFIKSGRRREYKEWFKAQVVEECHKAGASVSIVARRHDINANVLFRWRREYRLGILRPSAHPPRDGSFVSVGMIGSDGKAVAVSPAKAKPPAVKAPPIVAPALRRSTASVVELHLSGRVKMIRILGDVNKDALQNVLAVARELA